MSAGPPVASNVGDRAQINAEVRTAFEGYPAEASEVRPIFQRMLQNGIPVEEVSEYIKDTAAVLKGGDRAAFTAHVDRMDSISRGRNERADAGLASALAEVDANTRGDGTVTLGASSASNILARAGITIGSPPALEAGFSRNSGSVRVNAELFKSYLRAQHASSQNPGDENLRRIADKQANALGALGPILVNALQPNANSSLTGLAGTSASSPRPTTSLPGTLGGPTGGTTGGGVTTGGSKVDK